MDFFGRKRIAELESELNSVSKSLSTALASAHFIEVAKNFKLTSLPREAMEQIINDMKPYIIPELHRVMEKLAMSYGRETVHAIASVAVERTLYVHEIHVKFPAVTVPLQISSDYFSTDRYPRRKVGD